MGTERVVFGSFVFVHLFPLLRCKGLCFVLSPLLLLLHNLVAVVVVVWLVVVVILVLLVLLAQ